MLPLGQLMTLGIAGHLGFGDYSPATRPGPSLHATALLWWPKASLCGGRIMIDLLECSLHSSSRRPTHTKILAIVTCWNKTRKHSSSNLSWRLRATEVKIFFAWAWLPPLAPNFCLLVSLMKPTCWGPSDITSPSGSYGGQVGDASFEFFLVMAYITFVMQNRPD